MSPTHLIHSLSYVGLFGIIFAETGLLVGFFLPGDSLLVTAGVLAAGRHPGFSHPLNLGVVLIGCAIAAIAGAQVGYLIGRSAGPALWNRPKSRFFKPEHVDRAQGYFDKYGNRTIVLARFIPVVRTFANPMAGVARMDARSFTVFNAAGGLVWALGVTLLGYWIGDSVRDIYLIPAVILVSLVPLGVEALRHRRRTLAERVEAA